MNIAVVIHSLKSKGGGPRQVLELCLELQRLGHSVVLFAYDFNRSETYTDLCAQLTIKHVSDPRTRAQAPQTRRSPVHILRAYIDYLRREFFDVPKRLANLIDEPFDVINIHESPANLAAPFIRKRWPRTPIVWMCNDVWHIPAGGTLVDRSFAPLKRLYTFTVLAMPLFFDWRATRTMQHGTVLDHRIKRIITRHYHIPVTVVRSGVNIAQLESYRDPAARSNVVRRHGLDPESFILLCNSIYFPHRRFEDVIEAVALLRPRYPRLRLLIVGSTKLDPNYASRIERLIAERSLGDIVTEVKQFLPDRELYEYYQSSDVFIFPNDHQTWGLAPIEAMVLGKPVAVSRGAGVHEVITDGETGRLFPSKNPDELANVLAWYIDHPEERAAIARRGHAFAIQTFSWKKYAEQMSRIFTSVTNPQ